MGTSKSKSEVWENSDWRSQAGDCRNKRSKDSTNPTCRNQNQSGSIGSPRITRKPSKKKVSQLADYLIPWDSKSLAGGQMRDLKDERKTRKRLVANNTEEQPAKVDLNKKSSPSKRLFKTSLFDAQGFRKTKK